ncbi:MAG TPA: histidine phosphatase family protein [Methylomirabilota bacterium]
MKDRKPAPPTVVLLVRHGLTPTTGVKLPGRARGLHLSDEGRRQAEAAAARIAKISKIVAIYSSPLERARETAGIIAKARNMAVRIERGLLEIDIGRWTGLAIKDASARPEWKAIQQHPSGFRFEGGESFTEMQARVTGAILRIVARHSGRIIVAVSHADPIKAAVAHAIGTPLDLFQRIMIGTASISALVYSPSSSAALTVNSMDGDLAKLGIK